MARLGITLCALVAAAALSMAPPSANAYPPEYCPKTIEHYVLKGETLWSIAQRYFGNGSSYLKIVRENNIDNPDLIKPGDRYRIPGRQYRDVACWLS